jgi:hypothetical protein
MQNVSILVAQRHCGTHAALRPDCVQGFFGAQIVRLRPPPPPDTTARGLGEVST